MQMQMAAMLTELRHIFHLCTDVSEVECRRHVPEDTSGHVGFVAVTPSPR